MEKRGVPSSTVVSSAFLTHARLAAKNLQLGSFPLLVTPHPLNDLTPEDMRELARAAYPVVIRQLTASGPLEEHSRVDFVHPAARRAHRQSGGKESS
jgi:hypothetical protein